MEPAYVAAITGLIGAAIGSASSIATIVIQSRIRDRRDRLKQATDLALEDYKFRASMHPKVMPPMVVFLTYYLELMSALERGNLTREKLKELGVRQTDLIKFVHEQEMQR
jgi:hypothetical protein